MKRYVHCIEGGLVQYEIKGGRLMWRYGMEEGGDEMRMTG